MCDCLSSEMRRNPGFESAAIVLPSADDCQKYLGKRVRVVGLYSIHHQITNSVKEFKGKELTLQQGDRFIHVKVNEYYQNEHLRYRFIEVIGIVESVESDVNYDSIHTA